MTKFPAEGPLRQVEDEASEVRHGDKVQRKILILYFRVRRLTIDLSKVIL